MKSLTIFRSWSWLAILILPLASCRSSSSTVHVVTADDTSTRGLAKDVDRLEQLIEKFGSVVVKQPDVWGQARLTRYRDEYEQQMSVELTNFQFTLQGSIAGSDQAYLADAAALSAAASGSQATVQRPRSSGGGTSTTTNNFTLTPGGLTSPSSLVHTTAVPAAGGSPPTVISPMALPDPNATGTFGAFNNVSRTGVNMPQQLTFAGAKNGISVEPPIYLDQKSHYLNHLHELRRMGEGDDTADSPGYALNLVRFPVSVLPGQKTDKGYGAEVALTLRPFLTEELLPTTFRNLVINDVVDQLSFPITQFINDPQNEILLDPRTTDDSHQLFRLLDLLPRYENASTIDITGDRVWEIYIEEIKNVYLNPSLQPLFKQPRWTWFKALADKANKFNALIEQKDELERKLYTTDDKKSRDTFEIQHELTNLTDSIRYLLSQMLDQSIKQELNELNTFYSVAQSKQRQSRLPFPPEQTLSIVGYESFLSMAKQAYSVLSNERNARPAVDQVHVYIHLPDVQGFLREKLAASYDAMSLEEHLPKWEIVCPKDVGLVSMIRDEDSRGIYNIRESFRQGFTNKDWTHSKALSWTVLVESALLNEHLKQDMRNASNLKNGVTLDSSCVNFYGPNPSPEARQLFNEYMQIRWPIHVFALEPESQDQNLQSTFSSRREMQLALSLAFVNGRINANNMLRYARRLEFDYATIDLNGTTVGYSHGNETFGWRFYPRFQTPDIECNAKVLSRDLLLGGPNKDAILKQRRLEPGIRECYAVVIMPAFVPYASLNVSSSWFDLTNPRKKRLDSSDAMALSERVKALECASQCIVDGGCYRDGDLGRLMEKARQLETRLPLQNTQVQIPYENTLGGFAMFNAGITELAPELHGWYGTSSINPNAPTTVFLVGRHFSVHQTNVIAGGQQVTNIQPLSREVMQVTIPQNPILVGDAAEKFVDVQLATPYGVTQHLLIPAVTPPKPDDPNSASPQGLAWSAATLTLGYAYGATGLVPASAGNTTPTAPVYKPTLLMIQPGDIDVTKFDAVDITLKFDKKFGLDKANPIKVTASYDGVRQGYVVPLADLSQQIYSGFDSYFGPEDVNPPSALSSSTVLVFRSTKTPGTTVTNRTTSNSLTIQWIKSPAASAAGAKTGP